MKRFVSILMILILLASVLTGCGGKPAAEQSSGGAEVQAAEAKAAEDTEKATENALEIMETLTNKEWPKDKLPAELPEYTEGEIVNSGGDSGEFYVKIDKTNKDALSTYLGKLKDLGWNVSEGRESIADKGIYELRFTFQGDEHIQMVLYTSEIGKWPKDKLPPDIMPPADCTLIGGMELIESEPGQAWYMNYQCDGINEEEASAYMDMLVKNGWSGDSSMVGKDIEWNGKKYRGTIEIYETMDNTSTFTLNLMIVQ